VPTIKIHGLDIYYEVHGSGPPLVLLHHGTGCTKMWEKLLPYFSATRRVVVYDRRGFGGSQEGERFRDHYLSDAYGRDCVDELSAFLQGIGVEDRLDMVGQCEGGAIAFQYAARYPDRVSSVVASSTLCASGTTVTEYCKGKLDNSFQEADPEFQQKMIWWHGEKRALELYTLFLQMGGVYGAGLFDLRDALRTVRCPSLVLYPDRSGLFEVEQGVMMYRALRKGELAVMPNCGHNTYLRVEEYQRQVLSFLERYPRSAGDERVSHGPAHR